MMLKSLIHQMFWGIILFTEVATYYALYVPSPIRENVTGHDVLNPTLYEHYISQFNADDEELYQQYISNANSWNFLANNIPFFDCPDKEFERVYYFRWWVYRKHIRKIDAVTVSDAGDRVKLDYVITEFLPNVSWSGSFNTISAAAAHHIREGRWLHSQKELDSYSRFWFSRFGKHGSSYSFWPADSMLSRSSVTGNLDLLKELLPAMIRFHEKIKVTNYDSKMGLYFNKDDRDGMEASIGGRGSPKGYRPTLNSYRYGEAVAIGRIADIFGYKNVSSTYKAESFDLKHRIISKLWDEENNFFKVIPHKMIKVEGADLATPQGHVKVRELHGYTPWYFSLPIMGSTKKTKNPDVNSRIRTARANELKLKSFSELLNSQGFDAPYGLTTAEQRNKHFQVNYNTSHECLWDGPSWPYATSMTLTAVANILSDPRLDFTPRIKLSNSNSDVALSNMIEVKVVPGGNNLISKDDYFRMLITYAKAHKRLIEKYEFGWIQGETKIVSWIDENLDPFTGNWISRSILNRWRAEGKKGVEKKGNRERGKDYNHSTFVDLVLSGLIGIKARIKDDSIIINPLLPQATDSSMHGLWTYFCVDRIRYHNRWITVVWDLEGSHYNRGPGLQVFSDGILVASSPFLKRMKIKLPPPLYPL